MFRNQPAVQKFRENPNSGNSGSDPPLQRILFPLVVLIVLFVIFAILFSHCSIREKLDNNIKCLDQPSKNSAPSETVNRH